MFLRNFFHVAVANLCTAGVGLKRYIDNGCTFIGIPANVGRVDETLSFLDHRGRMDLLKDRITESRAELLAQGGNNRCAW
jgi:hypothetical protein